MGSTKRKQYVCDFETTTDIDDCRVWAWCLVDIETSKTVEIGNNIESLFSFLENKNSVVYFHNLKFDGSFLLAYLTKSGYKHTTDKVKKEKTFETLITDAGVFYSITVTFKVMKRRYNKVVFYDSFKKLPFKVSVISKTFELEDKKLKIDYDEFRPIGHELTEQERQYIVNDCRIVAQALKVQFDEGLTKMTSSSDALAHYKKLTPYFEKWFPEFPLELDSQIRQAYKGGFTCLNPKYKDKRIKEVSSYDVNSLYPSVMRYELLPYGYPMFFEGEYEYDEQYPLYICKVWCSFKLKENHVPTIQLKNNYAYMPTEYLTTSNGQIECLMLTSVDLQLLKDHYDVSDYFEVECGWKFKGVKGMFNEYIDYWGHIKETTTGGRRQLAKNMLNSLYGKFATNPRNCKKVPYLDSDGVVKYQDVEDEPRTPIYTAMGCFITAYARNKTIRSAQSVYDRWIYCDTDSLHIVGYDKPETLDIHPTRLGAWKHEGDCVDSKFIRAKTYMETVIEYKNDTLENYCKIMNKTFEVWRECNEIKYHNVVVKCAGMPDNIKEQVTYDNFHVGSWFEGKLVPKSCVGGVVLEPKNFTIR